MITVTILINGNPIYTRSARRIRGAAGETCTYYLDNGETLKHDYDDGAIELSKKLLDTIREIDEQPKWVTT